MAGHFGLSSELIFIHNHAMPYINLHANLQTNLAVFAESRANAVSHSEFATSTKLDTDGMYSDLVTCSLSMKTIGLFCSHHGDTDVICKYVIFTVSHMAYPYT